MSNSLPRVLIVFNKPVLPAGHPEAYSEADVLETVEEVENVLPSSDFVVERFSYARRPQQLLNKIEQWKPNLVFNLFEGEADRIATEVYHAGLLEWMCLRFTGAPAAALALGRDKIRTKYLLQGAGVSTAPFQVVEGTPVAAWAHAWPAIVKPAMQDASIGIDQGSVVTTQDQLDARVVYVLERYGAPVLVEQYIPGREFHVHVYDDPRTGQPQVVPPGEIRFEASSELWPIYTYQAKWNEKSVEYQKAPLESGITLPRALGDRVAKTCVDAYRLVGLRDYGRVDIRVTPDGRPFVLEVNPNPYLNSIILVKGLERLGLSFAEFVQGMARAALARGA